MTPLASRRRHALAPVGRAARLLVSLSPDDRAGLEDLAALWTRNEAREVSMAEVVRELIREAVETDREIMRDLG